MYYLLRHRRKEIHVTDGQESSGGSSLPIGFFRTVNTDKKDLTNNSKADTIESVKIGYIDEEGNRSVKKVNFTKKTRKSSFDVGNYLNLGYYIITPLLLGLSIGILLDKWLKTEPVFILAGIVFGTISTFYNLIKLVSTEHAAHKHKGRTAR